MTPDVLNSPAVGLLVRFEHEGYEVVAVGGRLLVKPADRLSPDDREAIRAVKDELLTLLQIVDDGVQRRRQVFAERIARGGPSVLPDLVMVPGLTPVAGSCVSCGEALERPRMGKCWRCCLAWRLAAGVPVPSSFAAVLDETRRVA